MPVIRNSMPLTRSCVDRSIDGLFRTHDISVQEIIPFEKCLHPDDIDTSEWYDDTT